MRSFHIPRSPKWLPCIHVGSIRFMLSEVWVAHTWSCDAFNPFAVLFFHILRYLWKSWSPARWDAFGKGENRCCIHCSLQYIDTLPSWRRQHASFHSKDVLCSSGCSWASLFWSWRQALHILSRFSMCKYLRFVVWSLVLHCVWHVLCAFVKKSASAFLHTNMFLGLYFSDSTILWIHF